MAWQYALMKASALHGANGTRGKRSEAERREAIISSGCEVVNGDETILVVCENGFGKRSMVEDFRQTNRGGVGVRSIITSERNGNVVGASRVTDSDGIVMISSSGQTVRITMKDVRVMGRNTQGVKLVNLKENTHLIAMQKVQSGSEEEVAELPPEEVAELPPDPESKS